MEIFMSDDAKTGGSIKWVLQLFPEVAAQIDGLHREVQDAYAEGRDHIVPALIGCFEFKAPATLCEPGRKSIMKYLGDQVVVAQLGLGHGG
jgi:hypothetical protein